MVTAKISWELYSLTHEEEIKEGKQWVAQKLSERTGYTVETCELVMDGLMMAGSTAQTIKGLSKAAFSKIAQTVMHNPQVKSQVENLIGSKTPHSTQQTEKSVSQKRLASASDNLHRDRSVEGLDLELGAVKQQKLPHKVLDAREKKLFSQKVNDRTLTKDKYEQYEWDKRFSNRRSRGVARFWADERSKLRKGEAPTRSWSESQTKDILHGKIPKHEGKPMQGHHTYNAQKYPHIADQGKYVYPVTESEHLKRWHGGKWQNETDGKPLKPKIKEDF